jgi:hypothetical protein
MLSIFQSHDFSLTSNQNGGTSFFAKIRATRKADLLLNGNYDFFFTGLSGAKKCFLLPRRKDPPKNPREKK